VFKYHYKDVFLIPNYSELPSRSKASTSTTLGKFNFKLPVIPSNMKCSIDYNTAKLLDKHSCFYIMHRFDNDVLSFVEAANKEKWRSISISIGVNEKDYETLDIILKKQLRVDFITIDVAHGHHLLVKNMLTYLKAFKNTFKIAGNIATAKAADDLIRWGADAVKVGIGQGYVCTTKDKTGFTFPMFSAVNEINKKYVIIADGGVKCNGDIAKAVVAGARLVMCGGMFAKLKDSPAKTIVGMDGLFYKEYYGSASFKNKNIEKNIEGKAELVVREDKTYIDKIIELTEDLQSAISYAGGTNLAALKTVTWAAQNI